jgi:hypothetical protein
MESKIAILRKMMLANDWISALKFAAKFPRLGQARNAILSAKDAVQNPDFYRQLRKDPTLLIQQGINALVEQYQERS